MPGFSRLLRAKPLDPGVDPHGFVPVFSAALAQVVEYRRIFCAFPYREECILTVALIKCRCILSPEEDCYRERVPRFNSPDDSFF